MTELAYNPEQTFQGAQERLVFVDPNDRRQREFEIPSQIAPRPAIGGDSPEVNQMVEDAYAAAQQERSDAAARTAEHGADDAELARAIDWNAEAIAATRDYAEANGL
jgi:uncharacterized membrane protein